MQSHLVMAGPAIHCQGQHAERGITCGHFYNLPHSSHFIPYPSLHHLLHSSQTNLLAFPQKQPRILTSGSLCILISLPEVLCHQISTQLVPLAILVSAEIIPVSVII